MNRYMDKLHGILHEWRLCEQLHMVKDKYLFRYANFWGGLIFTSAILENFLFHFKLCPPGTRAQCCLGQTLYLIDLSELIAYKLNSVMGSYCIRKHKGLIPEVHIHSFWRILATFLLR